MFSDNDKILIFVAWAIVVCLSGIALGMSSISSWVAVLCLAFVPPVVARNFWRAPAQTISQSTHAARR